MKQGRSLQDLSQEILRQAAVKKDYIVDTAIMTMTNPESGSFPLLFGDEQVDPTKLCHNQIAARLNIPIKYYDNMLQNAPELLVHNVNYWFKNHPERRMVRTLDTQARAFLSRRYRPLDNVDLAQATLPVISNIGATIKSCELTETRLYIKAVLPKLQGEVKKGDIVRAGIVISNSEVGCGSIYVNPLVEILACLNGMIVPQFGMKKYHIGKLWTPEDENAYELFSDETRRLDDKAFWRKVQDVIVGTFKEERFQMIVSKLQETAGNQIEGNPVKTIEVVTKKFGLSETEQGSVLKHLVEGGDLSQYGLSNAITRASQDVDSYDRATEMEYLGGKIIELPKQDWKEISTIN